MKRCIACVLFASLFLTSLGALHRDYRSGDYTRCLEHLSPQDLENAGITPELIKFIPLMKGEPCRVYDKETKQILFNCHRAPIYAGYIDPLFRKYAIHLRQQLEYCSKNSDCTCYWPECSKKAAKISDEAHFLFKKLFFHTALNYKLVENRDEYMKFTHHSYYSHNASIVRACLVHLFRFSDYYHVCRDIENYAQFVCDEEEIGLIKDTIEDILSSLHPKFLDLYMSCLDKHPSPEIEQEIYFMKLLVGDSSLLEKAAIPTKYSKNKKVPHKTKNHTDNKNLVKKPKSLPEVSSFYTASPFSLHTEILVEKGTVLNNLLLHKEAIKVLTKAIQLNPSNRDAYIERALAYFETNQLSLALQDYEKIRALTITPSSSRFLIPKGRRYEYVPDDPIAFATGLLTGTIEGSTTSAIEFFPSLGTCIGGIAHGLWAFACSPNEVSREMLQATYAMAVYVSSHSLSELACTVPEIKDLANTWYELDDYVRGKKIGYLISKYGTDAVIAIALTRGTTQSIMIARDLRKANTLCTLESCAASEAKRAKIVAESAKHVAAREAAVEAAKKSGKILIRNANDACHIMQKKHAWDNLVKLSGNVREDCKKIMLLLEENNILSAECFVESEFFYQDKILRLDFKKIINGQEVWAIFQTYVETGQTFLQNAWVVTK